MVDIRIQIRQRINSELDEIEAKMKAQTHLTNPQEIIYHVENVSKYFSIMNEDEKEFVGAVSYALRTKIRWD
jgi:hypothetical protein